MPGPEFYAKPSKTPPTHTLGTLRGAVLALSIHRASNVATAPVAREMANLAVLPQRATILTDLQWIQILPSPSPHF